MLREGVAASYVGPEARGLLRGDRVWCLNDNGNELYVRWTSGARQGTYENLRPHDLAIDSVAQASDEWGFEVGPHAAVTVKVAELHERGGDLAVLEALQAEGNLDGLEERAIAAVAAIREWMAADATWSHLATVLDYEDAERLRRTAISAAVEVATQVDAALDSDS